MRVPKSRYSPAALVLAATIGCAPIRYLTSNVDSAFAAGLTPGACRVTEETAVCVPRTFDLATKGEGSRQVLMAVPPGEPPAMGWPVVLLFQGSWIPTERMFNAKKTDPFGGYDGARMVAALAGAGFVVLAPRTHLKGHAFWDTNVLIWNRRWERSPDHRLMQLLFDSIGRGVFGSLDSSRLYAVGISSGGYMTSRMAVSYPGRFKALAIESASYATCLGIWCAIPTRLPLDHPPTLFLHGKRDLIVPVGTMKDYYRALRRDGIVARMIVDREAGHEWIPAAPAGVVSWFRANP